MTVNWLKDPGTPIDENAIKADGRERGVTVEFQGRTMRVTGPYRKLKRLKKEFGPDYAVSEITE